MVVLQWLYNLRIQYFNSLLTMLPKFCSLMTLMSELLCCFKKPYSLKIIKSMNLKRKHFPDVINITPTIWKALLYLFQHILMQFITHTLLEIDLNWVAQEVFQVDFFLIVTLCALDTNLFLQKFLSSINCSFHVAPVYTTGLLSITCYLTQTNFCLLGLSTEWKI